MINKDFLCIYLNVIRIMGFIGIVFATIFMFESMFLDQLLYGTNFLIAFIITGFLIYYFMGKKFIKTISIFAGIFFTFQEIISWGFSGIGWGIIGLFIFGILPIVFSYWLSVKGLSLLVNFNLDELL